MNESEFMQWAIPKNTPLHKARFQIDNEPSFEGYIAGTRWNGWAVPFFPKEESEKIAKHCNAKYIPERDSFLFSVDMDGQEFSGVDIDTEDGKIHAYPIGAGCWIWEGCGE